MHNFLDESFSVATNSPISRNHSSKILLKNQSSQLQNVSSSNLLKHEINLLESNNNGSSSPKSCKLINESHQCLHKSRSVHSKLLNISYSDSIYEQKINLSKRLMVNSNSEKVIKPPTQENWYYKNPNQLRSLIDSSCLNVELDLATNQALHLTSIRKENIHKLNQIKSYEDLIKKYNHLLFLIINYQNINEFIFTDIETEKIEQFYSKIDYIQKCQPQILLKVFPSQDLTKKKYGKELVNILGSEYRKVYKLEIFERLRKIQEEQKTQLFNLISEFDALASNLDEDTKEKFIQYKSLVNKQQSLKTKSKPIRPESAISNSSQSKMPKQGVQPDEDLLKSENRVRHLQTNSRFYKKDMNKLTKKLRLADDSLIEFRTNLQKQKLKEDTHKKQIQEMIAQRDQLITQLRENKKEIKDKEYEYSDFTKRLEQQRHDVATLHKARDEKIEEIDYLKAESELKRSRISEGNGMREEKLCTLTDLVNRNAALDQQQAKARERMREAEEANKQVDYRIHDQYIRSLEINKQVTHDTLVATELEASLATQQASADEVAKVLANFKRVNLRCEDENALIEDEYDRNVKQHIRQEQRGVKIKYELELAIIKWQELKQRKEQLFNLADKDNEKVIKTIKEWEKASKTKFTMELMKEKLIEHHMRYENILIQDELNLGTYIDYVQKQNQLVVQFEDEEIERNKLKNIMCQKYNFKTFAQDLFEQYLQFLPIDQQNEIILKNNVNEYVQLLQSHSQLPDFDQFKDNEQRQLCRIIKFLNFFWVRIRDVIMQQEDKNITFQKFEDIIHNLDLHLDLSTLDYFKLFNYHYKIFNDIDIEQNIINFDCIDKIILMDHIQGLNDEYVVSNLIENSDDIINDQEFKEIGIKTNDFIKRKIEARLSSHKVGRRSTLKLSMDELRSVQQCNVKMEVDSEVSSLNDRDYEIDIRQVDESTQSEERSKKFMNIKNIDLALCSGSFRGKLFKYLDKGKKNQLELEDTAELDDCIWNECQKNGNLINSNTDMIKTQGKAVVNIQLIDSIRANAFEFMAEDNKLPREYFKYQLQLIKIWAEVYSIFYSIDADFDNDIGIHEFMQQVKLYNVQLPNYFREYHKMDQRQDGLIRKEDFCRFQIVQRIMRDKDNGVVDADIISWVNRRFVLGFQTEMDNCFKVLPKSRTGEILRTDFINWFVRRVMSLKIKNANKIGSVLRPMFAKFDTDNSGSMSMAEFKCFFWWIQAQLDAVQQFLWLDDDNSGSVSVKEFKKKEKWLQLPPSFKGNVESRFKQFDRQNKGLVTLDIQAKIYAHEWSKHSMTDITDLQREVFRDEILDGEEALPELDSLNQASHEFIKNVDRRDSSQLSHYTDFDNLKSSKSNHINSPQSQTEEVFTRYPSNDDKTVKPTIFKRSSKIVNK